MDFTNEVWKALVEKKVTEVLADTSTTDYSPGITSADENFARTIDHTLLRPDATPSQINQLCDEAIKYGFRSCCVNGSYASQVAEKLKGSKVFPCVVVGFPLGAAKSSVKAMEAREAVNDGALEVDMVLHVGSLKSQDYESLYADVYAVVSAVRPVPVKVILETVLLTDQEKIAASFVAAEAGAAFVKTCTGFAGGAAEVRDVQFMKKAVAYKQGAVSVKASGGLRTFEKCLQVLKAGAHRIGTSSGVALMGEAGQPPGSY